MVLVAMGVLLGGCLMQVWVEMGWIWDVDMNVPPTPARALRMFSVILAVVVAVLCGFCSCRSICFP
jgi:hypothetical protein